MMGNGYDIVFSGEIIDGSDLETVKNKLATALELNAEQLEELFSGKPVTIRENSDLETCEKVQKDFLDAGAVCSIVTSAGLNGQEVSGTATSFDVPQEDHEPAGQIPQKIATDNNASSIESEEVETHQKNRPSLPDIKQKVASIISQCTTTVRSAASTTKATVTDLWKKGSETMKSDYEDGGMEELARNKYFQVVAAVCIAVLVIFFASLLYKRESMPLNDKNLATLRNHIEFIEKAFTIEELEAMTKNPNDYLDYLLVDPVKKMGYEFEASIGELAEEYLDHDLSQKQLATIHPYLKITTQERAKLRALGFISEDTQMKLESVAKTINQ